MSENIQFLSEPLPDPRPRWATNLCWIFWGLAHVFGAISVVFINCSLVLYEKGELTAPTPPASTSLSPNAVGRIKVFDKAAPEYPRWALTAGSLSLLLIITGIGLWRMKKWSILPIGVLILIALPPLLAALGLKLSLFK
jgi:hypothetical protein